MFVRDPQAIGRAERRHSRSILDLWNRGRKQAIAPYLITHCILGCIIGLVWGFLLLATDTARIRELLSASSYPAATLALFLLGSIISILPVVLATAIGRLAE